MQQVEELADLTAWTENQWMSFGGLVDERVEEAATRHLETAPIAIHPMHPSNIAQSLFRHRW